MKVIACLVAVIAMNASLMAQTPDPQFPAQGTIIRASPVFWIRDANRTPIILLPAGLTVQVLGREGLWYKIVFPSAAGNQTAYIAPYDVRIDPNAASQTLKSAALIASERGFVEARGFGFAQKASNDGTQRYGDALFREEVFLKPARLLQFAGGVDLRARSHGQVDDKWRLDLSDRGVLRPRIALRRLTATLATSHVNLDVGKQFIRWGRADILSPTDRFAPRDYLNVIDTEFLPVAAARASIHARGETFELVWVPRMTPSRVPILTRRWTVLPPAAAGFTLEDKGSVFPDESEQGVRWSHAGRFEMGLSVFNGFNHLPDISAAVDPVRGTLSLLRTYPALRTYGGEISVPTPAVTLKGEAAYITSRTGTGDEYVLYVIEAERQVGEWLFDGGYAGESVTKSRGELAFAAERGMARSIIGRAAYTVDPRRTVAIEGAARQNGHGLYAKGEFSEIFGQHWRITLAVVGIRGKDDDFLGQYQRNSHVSATLRLSF